MEIKPQKTQLAKILNNKKGLEYWLFIEIGAATFGFKLAGSTYDAMLANSEFPEEG